jgi:dTDP-4-amino-4,6-dideoxygalactose transaminase
MEKIKNRNPYRVTEQFESMLCEYTGARFAVALNSCTAAILLALLWWKKQNVVPECTNPFVGLPRKTYVSVACAAKLAGYQIEWRDEEWTGAYQLTWTAVFDCARKFTSGMYFSPSFQCVSFAASKILGAEQGGAILHDNEEADLWFRRMRFDGRTEGVDPLEDTFDLVGHHCLMLPSVAATLLVRLYHLPKHNEDLPHYEYPDLSQHPAFK